jgi:hypothetical protein
MGVALAANDEIVVADSNNHAIRVVTTGGAVRTLAGNGKAGFADGQGADARFNNPIGLARDKDGSILVADASNNAVRRVTMEGEVSTVAGGGKAGYEDGEGAAARFNWPTDVVVDKEGTIVVAETSGRLRKIVGRQVTTLASLRDPTTPGGGGVVTIFRLALDEHGRLLVVKSDREDTLWVVDASLAPPVWMGPAADPRPPQAWTRLRQELARLRGTGIESLEARELAQLRTELEEGLRRVKDAELRRNAEERVASQTNSFLCPIGCELMRDPVMAADGHTYERVKIEEWIRRKRRRVTSPKTNERLEHTMLTPNYALKSSIDEAIENVMRELRQAPPAT